MKQNKIEHEFLNCKKTEDYVSFALKNGAQLRMTGHWFITHPNGRVSTLSKTTSKKKGIFKTRKEFAEIYQLSHLI